MKNSLRPVMEAEPSTSGMIARCDPKAVASSAVTVNRLPIRLSTTLGCPIAS